MVGLFEELGDLDKLRALFNRNNLCNWLSSLATLVSSSQLWNLLLESLSLSPLPSGFLELLVDNNANNYLDNNAKNNVVEDFSDDDASFNLGYVVGEKYHEISNKEDKSLV